MFKSALVYHIEQWDPPTRAEIEQRLERMRFVPCSPAQPESAGWVAPRGEAHAALLESVAGQLVLKLCTETRPVPAGAVKEQLQARLDQIEADTGRRPKGKAARELKEQVVHELRPRAFSKRSTTVVWLDREARRVYIHDTELDPPLSLPQYRLLELLYLHAGRVCTRETVVETVWPDVVGEGVSEQAIDALVRRLRDRLAELDPEHQYIVTMRGHGFRLDNPSE